MVECDGWVCKSYETGRRDIEHRYSAGFLRMAAKRRKEKGEVGVYWSEARLGYLRT